MDEIVVSVFGTGRVRPGESAYVLAEQVGQTLAQAGFAIANGGYRGTMDAAAKGAASVGGTVIGVTCSAFKNSVANEYVTREIVACSLEERLRTLVELVAQDNPACTKHVVFAENPEQVADLLRKALHHES